MENIGLVASGAVPTKIARAASRLTEALLSEGKILCCGNGRSNALSQYFCSSLMNRFDQDRPSLPAINIGSDPTTFSSICRDNSFAETFSRQIRALGRRGDVLLLIVEAGHKPNQVQAVQAAHDREMDVIVISAGQHTEITSLMDAEDLHIELERIAESEAGPVVLLTLNLLCQLIDQQLFGA